VLYSLAMCADAQEIETIVAALRDRGVRHLSPSEARSGIVLGEDELVRSLVTSGEARLRQALIVLLLQQPRLAERIPPVCEELDREAATELKVLYTAAACLQRMWSIRLQREIPAFSMLPDLFGPELGVPSLDEIHGKLALYALADRHRATAPSARGRLAEFEGAFPMAIANLARSGAGDESSRAG